MKLVCVVLVSSCLVAAGAVESSSDLDTEESRRMTELIHSVLNRYVNDRNKTDKISEELLDAIQQAGLQALLNEDNPDVNSVATSPKVLDIIKREAITTTQLPELFRSDPYIPESIKRIGAAQHVHNKNCTKKRRRRKKQPKRNISQFIPNAAIQYPEQPLALNEGLIPFVQMDIPRISGRRRGLQEQEQSYIDQQFHNDQYEVHPPQHRTPLQEFIQARQNRINQVTPDIRDFYHTSPTPQYDQYKIQFDDEPRVVRQKAAKSQDLSTPEYIPITEEPIDTSPLPIHEEERVRQKKTPSKIRPRPLNVNPPWLRTPPTIDLDYADKDVSLTVTEPTLAQINSRGTPPPLVKPVTKAPEHTSRTLVPHSLNKGTLQHVHIYPKTNQHNSKFIVAVGGVKYDPLPNPKTIDEVNKEGLKKQNQTHEGGLIETHTVQTPTTEVIFRQAEKMSNSAGQVYSSAHERQSAQTRKVDPPPPELPGSQSADRSDEVGRVDALPEFSPLVAPAVVEGFVRVYGPNDTDSAAASSTTTDISTPTDSSTEKPTVISDKHVHDENCDHPQSASQVAAGQDPVTEPTSPVTTAKVDFTTIAETSTELSTEAVTQTEEAKDVTMPDAPTILMQVPPRDTHGAHSNSNGEVQVPFVYQLQKQKSVIINGEQMELNGRTLVHVPKMPFARLTPITREYYKYGPGKVHAYYPKKFLRLEKLNRVNIDDKKRSMFVFE